MDSGSKLPARIAFGRFRLVPHRRELFLDDQPIRLGDRAFDVLMVLIEARGAVVSKDALMAHVWSGQVVEENNLEVQISALRTVFGAGRALIRTVPRRGYRFTGDIREHCEPQTGCGPGPTVTANNLPQPMSELIGRDDSLPEILHLATAHRFVTLTGPGGIGKTRLGLAAAHRLLSRFPDGVWLADLGSISDPGLVPAAVATVIGLNVAAGAVAAQRVAKALGGKQLLLVLDNCEHLIHAVAMIVEALLQANPAASVIATSREPLRAEGEHVYPVPALDVPPVEALQKSNPLEYGAVRLFVERARASGPYFMPDGRQMPIVVAICRCLDGIPLAIELAAARVATLGIEELADRLGDRLRLLTGGRRTALPRHQTLRATLDWSYGLLSEHERTLLRRLAIFAGPFSLEAASTVTASPELLASELIAGISSLVTKSLVVHGVQGVARYRLLDTSHAYAIEKLDESGEREHVARRHAEYYRELFERAETEWQVRPAAEWLSEYGWSIDNLRAALDWAFSAGGDASLGVALTAAAAPLWMHLSLLGEYRGRVERSLTALAGKDARLEMRLNAALGASLVYSGGAAAEIEAAWRTTHHLAIGLGDVDYQLRSLWGLWLLQHVWLLQHPRALATARQFSAMAAAPADRLVGERMLGVSYHHLGDLSRARRHLERVDIDDVVHDSASGIGRFQVDQRPAAHTYLARILWLQGLPARATRLAESTVERARAADHANSLCHALALAACPIAVWVGNLHLAERHVALLDNYSERHALALWRPFVSVHRGLVSIRRGDVRGGLRGLRTGLDAFDAANTGFGLLMFTGDLAAALGLDGQVVEGLAAVNEAIDRSTGEQERWMLAELLRIRGELFLSLGGDDATTAAEEQFRKALEWARRQGGLSWELRAATSLARLLRDRGQPRDALACLQPVFARFTEEFDTADLATAKLMLNELR